MFSSVMEASSIVPFRHRITIRCPICLREQRLERAHKEWFPISPFCCNIMRDADTPEWNNLLDKAISAAQENV